MGFNSFTNFCIIFSLMGHRRTGIFWWTGWSLFHLPTTLGDKFFFRCCVGRSYRSLKICVMMFHASPHLHVFVLDFLHYYAALKSPSLAGLWRMSTRAGTGELQGQPTAFIWIVFHWHLQDVLGRCSLSGTVTAVLTLITLTSDATHCRRPYARSTTP